MEKFSWLAAGITFGVCLVGALVSFYEGTFSRRQWRHKNMSFLWNWAVSIGDGFIFPIINGLILPHLWSVEYWLVFIAYALGLTVTYFFYQIWWKKDENLGHVFISWSSSGGDQKYWMKDITDSGWVHFFFMAFQVAVLSLYLIVPMDRATVLAVGGLMAIFLGIQNLQVVIVQGEQSHWAVLEFAWQLSVVIVVTALKY